jgi:uncharacterized protein with HEPN domain
MKKNPVIYIAHIKECIDRILTYTDRIDEKSFLQNKLLQDAVIRNFEVIGEATKKLNEDFRAE